MSRLKEVLKRLRAEKGLENVTISKPKTDHLFNGKTNIQYFIKIGTAEYLITNQDLFVAQQEPKKDGEPEEKTWKYYDCHRPVHIRRNVTKTGLNTEYFCKECHPPKPFSLSTYQLDKKLYERTGLFSIEKQK